MGRPFGRISALLWLVHSLSFFKMPCWRLKSFKAITRAMFHNLFMGKSRRQCWNLSKIWDKSTRTQWTSKPTATSTPNTSKCKIPSQVSPSTSLWRSSLTATFTAWHTRVHKISSTCVTILAPCSLSLGSSGTADCRWFKTFRGIILIGFLGSWRLILGCLLSAMLLSYWFIGIIRIRRLMLSGSLPIWTLRK